MPGFMPGIPVLKGVDGIRNSGLPELRTLNFAENQGLARY
jgi:hypothetical protein